MQRDDFVSLFEIMAGLPVTIRLLDPPLHEFLPHKDGDIEQVAGALGVPTQRLRERVTELSEFNPMLGFRGCRIAISFPEIPEMQARAIFEAAVEAGNRTGSPVVPEVMVPLVTGKAEFELLADIIDHTAKAVQSETGSQLSYQVGTMVELPRACLKADEIAERAEFFSFGTNDLTQTAYGLSRDDAAPILNTYLSRGLLEAGSFHFHRPGGGRGVSAHRYRAGAGNASRHQAWDLRRAWRGIEVRRLLRARRAGLCQLLAVPRADRPTGGRPGRIEVQGHLRPAYLSVRHRCSAQLFHCKNNWIGLTCGLATVPG